jgi:DnaK suppressor protein
MKRMKGVRDRERYLVLKGLLEERRSEIQDKLRSLRESLPAEAADVRDVEEQSVDDFVSEVDFALMEMKSETLRQIDSALRRLESGSYGLCLECGLEISEARLKALPFALMCRDCQTAQEEAQRTSDERARTSDQFSRVSQ